MDRPSQDDYVVRLARPDLREGRGPQQAEASWAPRRRRRRRRRLIMLAVLLVLFLVREPIMRVVDGVVDDVVADVTAVEDGIGGAVHALNRVYGERGSYETTMTELETLGPKVDWGDGISHRVCFRGLAAVVTSHGDGATFSRLLVRGEEWGQVAGDQRCPKTLHNPHPWRAPEADG